MSYTKHSEDWELHKEEMAFSDKTKTFLKDGNYKIVKPQYF